MKVILLVTCEDADGEVSEDARLYNSKENAEKWLAGYVDLLMEVHHHGVGDDGNHRHTDGRTYFESTYEGRTSRYTFKMYDLASKEDWNLIKDTSKHEKDHHDGAYHSGQRAGNNGLDPGRE